MEVATIPLTLVLVVLLHSSVGRSDSPTLHSDLVTKLLSGYQPHVVPLKDINHTLGVAAGLALIHIDSLSEEGVLSATAWLRLVWDDYRLQWDEADFGGASVFRINPKKIWLPDIEVYNTANPAMMSLSSQYSSGTNALVYPNGEVLYIPPISLKVFCHNFSHSAWPQGEQECAIKLGSWTYDGFILNLTLYNNKEHMDLSDMAPASPWVVTQHMEGTRIEKYYDCCPEPYPSLEFKFKVAPQYPVPDPRREGDLLHKLLIVCSTCLAVMIGGLCLLARLTVSMRGGLGGRDGYKMTLLRQGSVISHAMDSIPS